MIAVACERHPASELAGEDGSVAPLPAASLDVDPHRAPADVPANPAGAAPVSNIDKGGTPNPQPDVAPADKKGPAFFPTAK